jgi:hypothetical protein
MPSHDYYQSTYMMNKPRVEHYAPLMNRVERQLTSISSMLTQAGKLQLVNSVLSSLPTCHMCYVSIPIAIFETLTELGDTACGAILTVMPRASL